ncbi:MAG: hypothetical protein JKY60_15235 [Kordiimonadaceae bacterium]|nr:hypothetical protein [Kordiimonadaceae bacterium]
MTTTFNRLGLANVTAYFAVVGIVLFLLLGTGLHAQDNDAHRVLPEIARGMEPVKLLYVDIPPFTHSVDGKPSGNFLQIAHDVLSEVGLYYEFSYLPATRLYAGLTSGAGHVFIGPRNGAGPEDGSVIMGTTALANVNIVVLRLAGTEARSFDKLLGTSLITIQGYVYGGLVRELLQRGDLRVMGATNRDRALLLLKIGRAPYLLGYEKPLNAAMAFHPEIDIAKTPVIKLPWVFVVSKKAPNPVKLLELLEKGLAQIQARRAP